MSVMIAGPGRVRERPHARSVVVKMVPADPFDRLSPRELDALGAICTHDGGQAAARAIFVTESQCKNLLTAVYKKLGLLTGSRNKAARACFRWGYRLGQRDERERL